MVDGKKRIIKKFLHDYAVALGAMILLVVILATLILRQQGALSSVQDLSKINPLITSEQNELVAVNNSTEVVQVPKDDDNQDTHSTKTSTKTTEKTPSPSTSPSKGGTGKTSSGGDSTTGGSGGTGNGGGGDTSPPPVETPPFTANIGQMSYSSSKGCLLFICVTTYTVQAALQGHNAPGTVNYQWVEDGTTVAQSSSVQFNAGDTSKNVSFQWAVGKGHTVTLVITSPGTDQRTVDLE